MSVAFIWTLIHHVDLVCSFNATFCISCYCRIFWNCFFNLVFAIIMFFILFIKFLCCNKCKWNDLLLINYTYCCYSAYYISGSSCTWWEQFCHQKSWCQTKWICHIHFVCFFPGKVKHFFELICIIRLSCCTFCWPFIVPTCRW